MNIPFIKTQAGGNDFVMVDNRSGFLERENVNPSDLARLVCKRRFSIGSDDFLVIGNSPKADYYMHFYGPEGNKWEMCGNACRCMALYMAEQLNKSDLTFDTMVGVFDASINRSTKMVRVKMRLPYGVNTEITDLDVGDRVIKGLYLHTGVDHFVVLDDEVNSIRDEDELFRIAQQIRYHKSFKNGMNVNFVNNINGNLIEYMMYEREVEAWAPACGTGATAIAVALALTKGMESPMEFRATNGFMITIDFKREGNEFSDIYMTGEAAISYTGLLPY